jgi:hypothetical protein
MSYNIIYSYMYDCSLGWIGVVVTGAGAGADAGGLEITGIV